MGLSRKQFSRKPFSLFKNKKGIVFTILAVVIAAFFAVIFSANIDKPVDYKVDLTEARVSMLNDFTDSFFDYASEAGAVSGYFACQGILVDMDAISSYKPNFEAEYLNCIETGNISSTKLCPGMVNKTLLYYLNQFNQTGRNALNINSSYKISGLNISQSVDAFSIELAFNLTVSINDNYANLSETRQVVSSINIEGLQDPVYLINGTYNQPIRKSLARKKDGDWNYTDLHELYYNHTYRNYKRGISFINRIKGRFFPSMLGIESFVNHTGPGVVFDVNDTMVDYLFWQNVKYRCDQGRVVKITNPAIIAPPTFQLDETHRLNFNINSTSVDYTCPQS